MTFTGNTQKRESIRLAVPDVKTATNPIRKEIEMKIKNSTEYRTKELRKIFQYCLNRTGQVGENLIVDVMPKGRNKCRLGYAYYGKGDFGRRNLITVFMPRVIYNTVELVNVFLHELAHTRGIRHKEMLEPDVQAEELYDVLPLAIFPKEVKEKPVLSLVEKRHQKALKMQNKYEMLVKTHKKLLAKWTKKVKYYEGRSEQK